MERNNYSESSSDTETESGGEEEEEEESEEQDDGEDVEVSSVLKKTPEKKKGPRNLEQIMMDCEAPKGDYYNLFYFLILCGINCNCSRYIVLFCCISSCCSIEVCEIKFYFSPQVVKPSKTARKSILFSFCHISSQYSIKQRGKKLYFLYPLYNSTAGKSLI